MFPSNTGNFSMPNHVPGTSPFEEQVDQKQQVPSNNFSMPNHVPGTSPFEEQVNQEGNQKQPGHNLNTHKHLKTSVRDLLLG
jgi:hypothetical protein